MFFSEWTRPFCGFFARYVWVRAGGGLDGTDAGIGLIAPAAWPSSVAWSSSVAWPPAIIVITTASRIRKT